MFLSVFDIFKIGIGPSSSHTVGPMVAGRRFLDRLSEPGMAVAARVRVTLHGSLAFTGRGHHTDKAVVLGLLGERPDTVDPDRIDQLIDEVGRTRRVEPAGFLPFDFDPAVDLVFDRTSTPGGHPNAMTFAAYDAAGAAFMEQVYLSIGGGFVVTPQERAVEPVEDGDAPPCPYPFASAAQMLEMGDASGRSVAEMKHANESATFGEAEVDRRLDGIWDAMGACIDRGLRARGELPGGLRVRRRARDVHERLSAGAGHNSAAQHTVMDWLGVYAMAVNEENAGGGRVVTSPTNGAAGVIPAVLRYYRDHCTGADRRGVHAFLLTAAAIGGIIKHNASISGAEVGCQGEVGSASAMAAAGLCAALGGHNRQVENAAEVALEHHLGMTCDPIAGLVQVPCIERNAFGAVKAVTAASLALHGDGHHVVSLDNCIETMRQTGLDMSEKYKETSMGGLAVNVPQC